jgi:hypothetical protein
MCFGHRNNTKSNPSCTGGKGGSNTTTKRVQFSPESPQVMEIPHASQFSHRHLTSCFYTVEEFAYITAENNTILKYMMIGGAGIHNVETSSSTTRGLECKTLEGAEQKKIATLDGLCAVLLEQERQKQKNVFDDERIRQAYVAYTQVPAMSALKQGRLDAAQCYEGLRQQPRQPPLSKSGKGLQKSSRHFGRNYFSNDSYDMQSTGTTLVSDETASESCNGGPGGYGSVKKTRSIVRRLLQGSLLFPNKNNVAKQRNGAITGG